MIKTCRLLLDHHPTFAATAPRHEKTSRRVTNAPLPLAAEAVAPSHRATDPHMMTGASIGTGACREEGAMEGEMVDGMEGVVIKEAKERYGLVGLS